MLESYGGWLKTLVIKYETSNISSQSLGLPVLLISVPAFEGRNRENTFIPPKFQSIYNSKLSHWKQRLA